MLVREVLSRPGLQRNLGPEDFVHHDAADRDVELLDHADEAPHDGDREGERQRHEEEGRPLRVHEDAFRLLESFVHRQEVGHERVLAHLLHDFLLAERKLDTHAERLLPGFDHSS